MPFQPKQHRLFEGIAHGSIAPRKGLSRGQAMKLASEGVLRNQQKIAPSKPPAKGKA